jgi:hypothetical protein
VVVGCFAGRRWQAKALIASKGNCGVPGVAHLGAAGGIRGFRHVAPTCNSPKCNSGRARLLPSRAISWCSGSAGASPSLVDNHPTLHPDVTSDGMRSGSQRRRLPDQQPGGSLQILPNGGSLSMNHWRTLCCGWHHGASPSLRITGRIRKRGTSLTIATV